MTGAALAEDGKDWPKLWAFYCGLAGEDSREELEAEADAIARRGLTPVPRIPVPWYQPTVDAYVRMARDAYGARFLLTAPFSDPGQPADPDHWYACGLDWCADGLVVAAGAYGSPVKALAEWRASAGPSAATAELASCQPELGIRLLDPASAGSLQAESVFGDEPAEFLREIPRLSRRAGTASILRDSYEPDWVNKALALLPDWTQWCASKTSLDAEAAGRALAAARTEAANLASEARTIADDEAPFRRPE